MNHITFISLVLSVLLFVLDESRGIPFKLITDYNNQVKLEINCNDAGQLFTAVQAKHDFVCAPGTDLYSPQQSEPVYCPEGWKYSEKTGRCLQSKPSIFNNNRICPLGSNFDTSTGSCLPMFVPYIIDEIVPAKESPVGKPQKSAAEKPKTFWDCKRGETFIPAVQLCVPVEKPSKKITTKSGSKGKPRTSLDCPKGTTFVSEVQLCVEYGKPKRKNEYKTEKLSKNKPNGGNKVFKNEDDNQRKKKECPPGTVWVKELKICAKAKFPVNKNQTRDIAPSSDGAQESSAVVEGPRVVPTTISDDEDEDDPVDDMYMADEGENYTEDYVSSNGCKKHEVYVSELDICVPFDNCYPHDNC